MRRLWADRFREAGLDPVITLLALIVIAVLLALMASGCDLMLTNSSINQNDNSHNDGTGPTGPSGVNGGPLDFKCARAYCNSVGHCSGIACTWVGGAPFDLCATGHATLPDECVYGVLSGAPIDPGPPGNGAGTWLMLLRTQGTSVTVAGPVPVTTDS